MKKVTIVDYSEIRMAKENGSYYGCCDSGTYVYYEIYTKRDDGKYEVKYSTSADFQYCKIYGHFQKCEDCWEYFDEDSGDCTAEPETLTEEELLKIISNVRVNSDIEVEIE